MCKGNQYPDNACHECDFCSRGKRFAAYGFDFFYDKQPNLLQLYA